VGNEVKIERFDELLKKHIGSVKLGKSFVELRKKFDEEMAEEAVK